MDAATTQAAPGGETSAATAQSANTALTQNVGNLMSSALKESGTQIAPPTAQTQPAQTAPASTTQTAKQAWLNEDGTFAENWFNNLPEDLRNDKTIRGQKDITGVMKTLVHSQKMLGSEKLVLPGKNAKPEDWNHVYDRLGRPETHEKYDLTKVPAVPQGSLYDSNSEKAFLKHMHDAGLNNDQVAKIVGAYRQHSTQPMTIEQKQAIVDHFNHEVTQARMEETGAELKREYGAAYGPKLAKAAQAIRANLGNEKGDALIAKYGNDADFVRLMVSVANRSAEDTVQPGQTGNAELLSPAEAKAALESLKVELHQQGEKHPMRDRSHPQHKQAVERWSRLHELQHVS